MSAEVLDLRAAARILRRHLIIVGIAAMLGLLAGAAFALVKPPMRASTTLVLLPPAVRGIGAQPARYLATQLVIATSYPVLAGAARSLEPPVAVATLHDRVTVTSPSADLIAFTAQGTSDAQAEETANAVARSYIGHLGSSGVPGGSDALLVQRAAAAAGTSLATRIVVDGGVGAVLGALAGALFVLATRRTDRRLRERDQIADATGIPVLASIPVRRPASTAGWARLLDGYQPDAAGACSLRQALYRLGLTDGHDASLAMVSLSTDHRALALGPQLATFAASLGIPTTLVLRQDQDGPATAGLQAACAARPAAGAARPGEWCVRLAAASDHGHRQDQPLTVIIDVVDPQAPRAVGVAQATATVLGVSAGAATAEELARVAVGVADGGRRIAGILLADPDPADETTGRLPRLAEPRPLTRPSAR